LQLTDIGASGYRRVKRRLNLKRFFSCRLSFKTQSDKMVISNISLFGKQLGGGLRNN